MYPDTNNYIWPPWRCFQIADRSLVEMEILRLKICPHLHPEATPPSHYMYRPKYGCTMKNYAFGPPIHLYLPVQIHDLSRLNLLPVCHPGVVGLSISWSFLIYWRGPDFRVASVTSVQYNHWFRALGFHPGELPYYYSINQCAHQHL